MAQLMPLPLTFSCFSKIQIDFTFLVPAYPGCPGKSAVKWACVGVLDLPLKLFAKTEVNLSFCLKPDFRSGLRFGPKL